MKPYYTDEQLLKCLGGLKHVVRVLRGVAHEEDCQKVLDGRGCDCGVQLAIDQTRAAIRKMAKRKAS